MDEHLLDRLFEVCRRHSFAGGEGRRIVVPEPYIPHFPVACAQWNGVLILAEAQNLANTEHDYPEKLREAHAAGDAQALWNRLNLSWRCFPKPFASPTDGVHVDVAVRPWQNGIIPFVVAALAEFGGEDATSMFQAQDPFAAVRAVMVSNAVPWSRVDACGRNLNPGGEEIRHAARFWEELLPELRPCEGAVTLVLAFGKTAERVVQQAAPTARMLALLGPFGLNWARLRKEEQQLASALRSKIRTLLDTIGGQLGLCTPGDQGLAYLSAASAVWRWGKYVQG